MTSAQLSTQDRPPEVIMARTSTKPVITPDAFEGISDGTSG